MTYEEMWETAYSIGFHRGRMRKAQDHAAIDADRGAFEYLLGRIPAHWQNAATKRHNEGITDGDK